MKEPSSPPDPLLDPLFALAQASPIDTSRAEYAFETRLAVRLQAERQPAWGLAAWRLTPVFALVVLGLAAWQVEAGSASQEEAQLSAAQNPEAADLLASFN